MKFAFGTLVCLAAALIPAAQATVDITFTPGSFIRRDDSKAQPNPEFGRALANEYTYRGGKGMPAPKDVIETYPDCKWRSFNGKWGWMDENNIQCYLSPSYKYHAYSRATPFEAGKSLKAGACYDTPATDKYPEYPNVAIAVPYLYMNNLYDRRCKVRAMVKVPKTDEHDEFWVQAWVIDHDWGNTGLDGKDDPKLEQSGILIDTKLHDKFFNKNEKEANHLKVLPKVEWFFLDINTIGTAPKPHKKCKLSKKAASASSP